MLPNSGKSDPIVNSILPEPAAFATCALINNFDCANDASETFLFCNSAYNPASFENICGTPLRTAADAVAILLWTTPETAVDAVSVTDFRSDEIAVTRLNEGSLVAGEFEIRISPILSDPNVFPEHVNTLPLTFTLSEGDNSLIGTDFKTKSPEKSTPDINVSSWWTDITSSRPFFCVIVIDLINELSPFILIFSPAINVPDTCSKPTAVPEPAAWANPVAPLLNPSTKLPIGNSLDDSATFTVNAVNSWISYKYRSNWVVASL